MKFINITIKQTVEYTAGYFKGQRTERYIKCYTDKQLSQWLTTAERWGSPVKLISAEVLK